MKIVYCIPATYNCGGMERVLSLKANYFANLGHEIVIVTSDQHGRQPYFRLHTSIRTFDLEIGYEDNNGKSLVNKLSKYPIKLLRHRKRLSDLLFNESADITISMFGHEAVFLHQIKDGSHKILESHFSHNKHLHYQREGLWRIADIFSHHLQKYYVKRYKAFVVLTHHDSNLWSDKVNAKVIPNPCLLKLNGSKYAYGVKRLIAIGRYEYQKGFDRLIYAWKLISHDCQDWHLDIVGDGSEKQALQQLIRKLNLSDNVHLIPSTHEIDKQYLNASILLSTSRYEGLPMTMIEAQTYGLPIIAMDCECGPREIVTHGVNGLLVPDDDIKAFAEAIKTLISDSDLRLAMSRSALISSSRYNIETVMQQWIQLFNDIQL